MTTKTKNAQTDTDKTTAADKEIMALIQIVNGLNEVVDDKEKLCHVVEYVNLRYRQALESRVSLSALQFTANLSDALKSAENALKSIRSKLDAADTTDAESMIAEIDTALEGINATLTETKFTDLNAYKIYKQVMKESA
jgi:flagellin-like hook-associated protein FlgL